MPFTGELYQYSTSSGDSIDQVPTVRDLGLKLSDDCSWSPHIHQTVCSGRKVASWVLSVFRDRSPTVMVTLFKTMVRSRLEYGLPVWNAWKIGDIQSLEDVQRYLTKRISGCQHLSYWDRLKRLNLMSLQRRRERFSIIHVWKILNKEAPNDVEMNFYENSRLGMKVKIPKFSHKAQASISSCYDHSFAIRGARLWNLLPKTLNSETTLEKFKVALGSFLDLFPDMPPVAGYTTANTNSLLDYGRESGVRTTVAVVPL